MPSVSSLSKKLIRLRESRGMSGRKFASVCGLSRESIRKYEMDQAIPTNQTIFQIFSSLNIDPEISEEAKELLSAIYYARINRIAPSKRAYGAAANEEIKVRMNNTVQDLDSKIDAIVDILFVQLDEKQKTDSLKHHLKRSIRLVLEN